MLIDVKSNKHEVCVLYYVNGMNWQLSLPVLTIILCQFWCTLIQIYKVFFVKLQIRRISMNAKLYENILIFISSQNEKKIAYNLQIDGFSKLFAPNYNTTICWLLLIKTNNTQTKALAVCCLNLNQHGFLSTEIKTNLFTATGMSLEVKTANGSSLKFHIWSIKNKEPKISQISKVEKTTFWVKYWNADQCVNCESPCSSGNPVQWWNE